MRRADSFMTCIFYKMTKVNAERRREIESDKKKKKNWGHEVWTKEEIETDDETDVAY